MTPIMWTPPQLSARTLTEWTKAARRTFFCTFAHSKRFQAAIELIAIVALVNAALLYFNYWFAKQFVRCVIAHIETWIVQAQNDR